MRFLRLLCLFLYILMGLHTAFDEHIQVLCIEADGSASIETYDLAKTTASQPDSLAPNGAVCCADPEHDCGDCQDFYIGNGHPDTLARWSTAVLDLQNLTDLVADHPLVLAETPLLTRAEPPPLIRASWQASPAPQHLSSTVLLI